MAANPEPCDDIPVHDSQCTIAERDADRPHALFLIDALKVEGRMNGGFFPEEECLARRLTNVVGKTIVRFPKAGQRVGGQSLSKSIGVAFPAVTSARALRAAAAKKF